MNNMNYNVSLITKRSDTRSWMITSNEAETGGQGHLLMRKKATQALGQKQHDTKSAGK